MPLLTPLMSGVVISPGGLMLPALSVTLMVAVGGLCLGSFATALAYRLPRDIPLLKKTRSACPRCGHDLSARDLVPVLSWLAQRGRCRYCGDAIGWGYPAVELATMLLCLLFYALTGPSLLLFALLGLAPVITAMADIDFRFRIIPDGLNVSVFALALLAVLAAAIDRHANPDLLVDTLMTALGASLAYGVGSWALRLGMMAILKKDPMGYGDIKFLLAAGPWIGLGFDRLALFMMISGLSGLVLGVIWKKLTREAEFPFGPSLLLALIGVIAVHGPGIAGF